MNPKKQQFIELPVEKSIYCGFEKSQFDQCLFICRRTHLGFFNLDLIYDLMQLQPFMIFYVYIVSCAIC
jgi:hypothetical protein